VKCRKGLVSMSGGYAMAAAIAALPRCAIEPTIRSRVTPWARMSASSSRRMRKHALGLGERPGGEGVGSSRVWRSTGGPASSAGDQGLRLVLGPFEERR
jgi:hypothetical protein